MEAKIQYSTMLALQLVMSAFGLLLFSVVGSNTALIVPAVFTLFIFLFSLRILLRVGLKATPLIPIGILMVVLVILTAVSTENVTIRKAFALFYITQMAIFLPQVSQLLADDTALFKLRSAFIFLALAVILVAAFWQLSGLAVAYRFGEPLAPGVFGFYMAVAAIVSLNAKGSRVLFPLFVMFALLSESRAVLLILVLGCLVMTGLSAKRILITLVLFLLGSALVAYTISQGWEPAFFKIREDISSGRFFVWAEVFRGILERPFLGHGESPEVFGVLQSDYSRSFGAHNSLLDSAYEYGLVFAVSSYLIFGLLWLGALGNSHIGAAEKRLINALSVSLLLRSMITSTFWTNMADATSLFIFAVLCIGLRGSRISRYLRR